jgi:quinolinate synthase
MIELNNNQQITPSELYYKLKLVDCSSSRNWDLESCNDIVPLINKINKLKKEKDALILAHSYCSPEVIYGVADFCSDSYALGLAAKNCSQKTIIFSGVRFMAETAKITSPEKRVFLPDEEATCSLAESLNASQLRKLKEQYPEHLVICYINCSVEIKALSDICVTSSNVYNIVKKVKSDKILFVPDSIMAENIRNHLKEEGIKKEIISTDGTCYVHEKFEIDELMKTHPQLKQIEVLSHPECKLSVTKESDFVGSTGAMIDYVEKSDKSDFLMLTECGLVNRLQIENPEKNFLNGCEVCKYMKMNNLENIYDCLLNENKQNEIFIEEEIAEKARQSINRMFELA